MRDVAICDPRDERAKLHPLRRRREIRQRGPTLQKVFPRPPDLRNLPKMVHHINRVEPSSLGSHADLLDPLTGRLPPTLMRVTAHLQPEPQPRRRLLLPPHRLSRPHKRLRYDANRPRHEHFVKPLLRQLLLDGRPTLQLTGQHIRRNPLAPLTIPPPTLRRRRIERNRHTRNPLRPGQLQPAQPPCLIEPKRVDHSRQPPPDPLPDHLLKQRERIRTSREIVLPSPHQRPQPITGHHQLRRKPLRRPGRLPSRPRPHQHHHTRRGEIHASV